MCAPYYYYTIDNKITERKKMSFGDTKNSFDKLL